MAIDMFLDIESIKGESADQAFKKHIQLVSWSWGASQNGTMQQGTGGGAGKVSVKDLSFTKHVDASSHLFLLHCCNGKHIPKATLSIRKAGGDPLVYQKLELTNCIVSSISTGGTDGQDRLTETIALNFAKFKFEYTKQKEDGSADGGPLPAGWDIPANVKV